MPDLTLTPATQLYRDIPLVNRRGRPTLHREYDPIITILRDGGAYEKLSHEAGGTTNHKQDHRTRALAQVLAALRGKGVPDHARHLDEVVEAARSFLESERRWGHCQGEVMSTTYWQVHSAKAYLTMWWIVLQLIQIQPAHKGLRQLAGEIITWVKVDRYLLDLLAAPDGLVQPVGIRCKQAPEDNEGLHLSRHAWGHGVAHTDTRRRIMHLENPNRRKLENRAAEVILWRLLTSPEGRLLERLTRDTVPGPLAAEVGVRRGSGDNFRARMPNPVVIHESRDLWPQIVWEVAVNGDGRVVERVASNHLAVPEKWEDHQRWPIGEVYPHPDPGRRHIPEAWTVVGPQTPVPDAPPWNGDAGEGGGNGEEEEAPENKMIPKWKIRAWLRGDAPGYMRAHIPEIVWQAQRLRDGEPRAEERLKRDVDRLRKGETP